MTSIDRLVTEVPSSLKRLARLVVRAFYTIEDALIIDILVRNACIKEDDIGDLLKFERKMLRARLVALHREKFIQERLRMETGPDGKAQKVNYYFINYKSFVNVVKYKLNVMRMKIESQGRDASSRASFTCTSCLKTFTDLEVDRLFNPEFEDLRCTHCGAEVNEDESAAAKNNSILQKTKFNEQMEPLYNLLKEVEGIKLAPEILEPEPIDLNTIRGIDTKKSGSSHGSGVQWSGEATRSSGFAVEDTSIDVLIGDDAQGASVDKKKEKPIWMTESTIITSGSMKSTLTSTQDSLLDEATASTSKQAEDIMSVLLAHEKKGEVNVAAAAAKTVSSEKSSDSSDVDYMQPIKLENAEITDSEDDDNDIPSVKVKGKSYPISEVLINPALAEAMNAEERVEYIAAYQEYCDVE